MKKYLLLLFASFLFVFMLSGCYLQESSITINTNGSVDVSVESLASPEAIEGSSGGVSFEENVSEMISFYNNYLAENPQEAKALHVEPISKETENGLYQGIKSEMKFESVDQMLASQLFANFNQAVPISNNPGMSGGVYFTQNHTMFGVTYKGAGSISFSDQGMPGESMEGVNVNHSFKFPTLFIKHNAHKTGELGTKLTWTATPEAPAEVEFSAFVPNIALAIATLIIVLMGIWIGLLLKASRVAEIVVEDEDEHDEVPLQYTFSDDRGFEEATEEDALEEDALEEAPENEQDNEEE